jgi:hypothetical protein
MKIGIIDADDANAALLASLDAIVDAYLSINMTILPFFSEREREFFVFLFHKKKALSSFLASC